jgi:hypothetical protein
MTPQERDVIAGIFDRLGQVAQQPRDPEAERLIAERLARQPYAPYAMAQAIHVQEQALLNMQSQIEQLQAEVEQLRSQPQPQPQGGFLSGLFGGAPTQSPRANPVADAAASGRVGMTPGLPRRALAPSGLQQPGMAGAVGQPGSGMAGAMGQNGAEQPPAGPWGQRAGGGFLATAMTTAAGVAGGMVLGNVLMNAFQGGAAPKPATPAADQTADASAAGQPMAGQPVAEPAAYEDPGMMDDGGFGDDWA